MFTIYGQPNCVFCERAKDLLNTKGEEYRYFTVGKDVTAQELTEMVGKPIKTVPQIFQKMEYIGGFDELQNHLEEN